MEKIKPAVDPAAVTARMLKDEKGTLVRVAIARRLFLWTGLIFFTLVLSSVGGVAAGSPATQAILSQGVSVMYPAFLLSLATLAHAAWSHAAYVRSGARSVPFFTAVLAVAFLAMVLPHFGLDAAFIKGTTGVDVSSAGVQALFEQAKSLIP